MHEHRTFGVPSHRSELTTGEIVPFQPLEKTVKTTTLPNGKVMYLCSDGVYRERIETTGDEPDWQKIVRFRAPAERLRTRRIGRLVARFINTDDTDTLQQLETAQKIQTVTKTKTDGLVITQQLQQFKQAHVNRDESQKSHEKEALFRSIGITTAQVRSEAHSIALNFFDTPIFAMNTLAEIQAALHTVSTLYPPRHTFTESGRKVRIREYEPVPHLLRRWLERRREGITIEALHTKPVKKPEIPTRSVKQSEESSVSKLPRISPDSPAYRHYGFDQIDIPRNHEQVAVNRRPYSIAEQTRFDNLLTSLFPSGMGTVTDVEVLYHAKAKLLNSIPEVEKSINGIRQKILPRDRPFKKILRLIDDRIQSLESIK